MRRLLLFVFIIIGLLLLLTLVLQVPAVQNIARQKTEVYLQDKLNQKVSIGKIRLEWLSNLQIDQFYVEDALKDTALYAGYLSASIDMNILALIRGQLSIHDIKLQDVSINNQIMDGDSTSTLTSILNRLFVPKANKDQAQKSALELDLKNISLDRVSFRDKSDKIDNSYILENGELAIEKVDITNKTILINTIQLNGPEINLSKLGLLAQKSGKALWTDTNWVIKINKLSVANGKFATEGWPNQSILNRLGQHMNDARISLENVVLDKGALSFKVEQIQALNQEGWGIKSFQVDKVFFDNHQAQALGMALNTTESYVSDSLTFRYDSLDDFKFFADRVKLDVNFKNTAISLKELSEWIPSMDQSAFIKKYYNQKVYLDGKFTGTLNELASKNTRIRLKDLAEFDGRIEITDLTKPKEAFYSLRINSLTTQAKILRDLIKGIEKLQNIDKLGNLKFKGSFDGSIQDFVAYGILNSELGITKMDMRMNTKNGIEQARYSGELELNNFDLKTWTGNSDWGKVSLKATVSDGVGLQAKSASASVNANVEVLEFKGYTYSNAIFNGKLQQRLLDGALNMHDKNADLNFSGKIDFTEIAPSYDFVSEVKNLDLYKLNLSKRPLALKGDIDISLQGKKIEDLIGEVNLQHLIIIQDTSEVILQNLSLTATQTLAGLQRLNVRSDWVDGFIEGSYTLKDIWPALRQQMILQFPEIAHSLDLYKKLLATSDSNKLQKYRFEFLIKDLVGFEELLHTEMYVSQPIKISGAVDAGQKYFQTNWNIPDLRVKNLSIFNSVGRLEAKGALAFTSSYVDSTISKDFRMPHVVLTADLSYNKMNFSIKTPKVANLINNVALNGTMELIDSTYTLKFATSQVSFLDRNWDILPDNEISFRPGFIRTKNLQFVNGIEKIEFASVGSNGLKAEVTNLDINWINSFMPLKQWQLKGNVNLKAEVENIANLKGLKVAGLIDSIWINDSYFGLLDLNAYTPSMNQPLKISLAMLDGKRQLIGEGYYDKEGLLSNGVKNNYQFKVIFKDFPLKLFEFLIDDIVDNTQGNMQGRLDITKVDNKPNFDGDIQIRDGGLKVNYLNTTYSLGTQPVKINNNIINVAGIQLKDELGNLATLSGGIQHDHFKNFRLDAGVSSNRFLVLKTTKEQNPDYYGTVVGNMVARFHGPFNMIDIDVQGTTARPSALYIPISQATTTTTDRLVRFRPQVNTNQDTLKSKRILAARGVSVGIDLTVNNDAEVSLIFDEKKGDILKGVGNGVLQMRFERSGDITMYGNYEVDRGEYLFTLFGVVNKPFSIKQGGTIQWNGDPIGAIIDLDAEYKGLTSNLINLLPEYENSLQSGELRTQANIDLGMHLYGELFKPEISFNIEIPNLTGNLRSIVDQKLNLLKSDQNALNQQVLGLMVWGSFLPPNQLVASSGVIGSTINNLSQFVSSQLSLLVENALKELVADNNVISGFDFDVNYYNNTNAVDINNLSIFDEVNINLGPKFFEDRLSVGVGANFVNSTLFDRLITPHFEVEYALTKDRRLKIRAYARKDDISQGQLKDRIGGGISWRKEFDSIEDFRRQLNDDLKLKKSEL